MICKYCGATIPDWLDFCPECMKSTDGTEPEKKSEPEQPAPAEVVTESEQPAPADPEPEVEAEDEDEEETPVAEVYQSPQRPKKTRRRKNARRGGNRFLWFLLGILFTAAVAAALVFTGVIPLKGAQQPILVDTDASYAEPADALLAYAKGMKDGDLEQMLETFAAETYLQHVPTAQNYSVNFDDGEVLRIWGASAAELQAAGTPLSKAVTAEKVRTYLIDRIMDQFSYPLYHNSRYYGYDADNGKYLIYAQSEEEMNDFIAQLPNTPLFQDVTIGEAFEVSDKLSEEGVEAYKAYMKDQKAIFGADDVVFYYIPLTIDGEDYLLGMELVQYDGKWYNNDLYLYGIQLKEDYAGNSYGGLIPAAAVQGWE